MSDKRPAILEFVSSLKGKLPTIYDLASLSSLSFTGFVLISSMCFNMAFIALFAFSFFVCITTLNGPSYSPASNPLDTL